MDFTDHQVRRGDWKLNWKTYGELWADMRLTRGALDKLVSEGQVRWVSGDLLAQSQLLDVMPEYADGAVRLGAELRELALGFRGRHDPAQIYYLADDLYVLDAANRLGAEPAPMRVYMRHDVGARVSSGAPDPEMFMVLRTCGQCRRELVEKTHFVPGREHCRDCTYR